MFSRRSKFSLVSAIFAACLVLVLLHSYRYSGTENGGFGRYMPRPLGGGGGGGVKSQSNTEIPKKIWYKLGPKGLDAKTRAWTDSCIKANPGYNVSFMNDDTADTYVKEKFGKKYPDLVELYLGLSVPIFKADLLRYLFLFAEGGVYLDLDVSCSEPIDQWVPAQDIGKVAVAAGWEFDVGWGENFIRQLATWTIMSAPNSPHMWNVVLDIQKTMRDAMHEHRLESSANLTMKMLGDVVDVTGPRRFTRSIFSSLEKQGLKPENMAPYEKLLEPKMMGDLLIMPGWAFAPSSNKYEDGYKPPSPYVTHHYAGTWKNDQGGEV